MTYLEAIIQHFGLPAGRVFPHMGAHLGSVAVIIQLSPEDHGAIGRLMGDDVIRVAVPGKGETNDIVRPADEHSSWGNWQEGQTQREVQHVDTPDEEPAGLPPHVYLYRNMLTDLQALAPLGRDETNGQYAVAIDQLTVEQMRVPHVAKQLKEIGIAYLEQTTTAEIAEAMGIQAGMLHKNNT